MNEGCHAGEVWEEDATFRAVGVGSQIVIPLDYRGGFLSVHHPSQVGIVQLCEAFYGGDLEEDEGEIELELGEAAAAVQTSRRRA